MNPNPSFSFHDRPRRYRRRAQSAGPVVTGSAAPLLRGLPADLVEKVLQCGYGHYPWDDWEKRAQAKGVPPELAALGRAVMREAFQHDWEKRLKIWCGWGDRGRCMIVLALRSPDVARQRWQRLLDTDGYRGEYDPKSGEWKSWP